jgi:serine/threonine-protein phosphatase 2A activator
MNYPSQEQINKAKMQGVPVQVTIPRVEGRKKYLTIETTPAEPIHKITSADLIKEWSLSEAYMRLLDFVISLNSACRNIKNTDNCQISEAVANTIKVLDTLSGWIDEIPPSADSQRFGNTAFRLWIDRLRESSSKLHSELMPTMLHKFISEVKIYLLGGFGDQTRIDYG